MLNKRVLFDVLLSPLNKSVSSHLHSLIQSNRMKNENTNTLKHCAIYFHVLRTLFSEYISSDLFFILKCINVIKPIKSFEKVLD